MISFVPELKLVTYVSALLTVDIIELRILFPVPLPSSFSTIEPRGEETGLGGREVEEISEPDVDAPPKCIFFILRVCRKMGNIKTRIRMSQNSVCCIEESIKNIFVNYKL